MQFPWINVPDAGNVDNFSSGKGSRAKNVTPRVTSNTSSIGGDSLTGGVTYDY